MKQLIIYADMEGASGIFDDQKSWLYTGQTDQWREHGRRCMTSDVQAIARAAIDFGIDDILLYDGHHAGRAEFNVILEELPPQVRIFDIPNREFHWRRIRGQAHLNPFGIITVGQHARFGEPYGYFDHTIQSPPIKNFFVNGLHIAEMGKAVLSFSGTPFLANIGCQASMKEALELSDTVVTIPVKDKSKNWEPSPEETELLIYQGVSRALENAHQAKAVNFEPPFEFSMELCEGFTFNPPEAVSWKGSFLGNKAKWEAPSLEIGLEIFNHVRALLAITD
ncbi:MAG: M55 family metallopeptidase [Defluviitaleaceae bacterium]|nr:M55 family metallopeptidase [Defluviitaleaceae bacterium]